MSSVRAAVLETPVSPAPTGDMAYRAVFSREQLEGLNDEVVNELLQNFGVISWLGPEKHTVFYPVRGGREFNLVLLRPDNLSSGARKEQGDLDEMRASYADWDQTWVFQKIFPSITVKGVLANCSSLLGSLQKIISCVPSVYKWKLTQLPELESWTKVSNS
jgi:salicylate hydroxylase